jgi:hypothetical protein
MVRMLQLHKRRMVQFAQCAQEMLALKNVKLVSKNLIADL